MAKTYNADEVSIVFAGILINSGWADGEFCRVEVEGEAFTRTRGSDGEATRSRSNMKGGRVTIRLMQSSDHNDQLSALHELDKRAPGGAGVGSLVIRDRNGRAIWRASQAWIVSAPAVSLDRTPTAREWPIDCDELIRVDGGNVGLGA